MEREKLLKFKVGIKNISKLIDEILIYDEKESSNTLTEQEQEKYKDLLGRFIFEFIMLSKSID